MKFFLLLSMLSMIGVAYAAMLLEVENKSICPFGTLQVKWRSIPAGQEAPNDVVAIYISSWDIPSTQQHSNPIEQDSLDASSATKEREEAAKNAVYWAYTSTGTQSLFPPSPPSDAPPNSLIRKDSITGFSSLKLRWGVPGNYSVHYISAGRTIASYEFIVQTQDACANSPQLIASLSSVSSLNPTLPPHEKPSYNMHIFTKPVVFDGTHHMTIESSSISFIPFGSHSGDQSISLWICPITLLKNRASDMDSFQPLFFKGKNGESVTPSLWISSTSRKLAFRVSTALQSEVGSFGTTTIPEGYWTHVLLRLRGDLVELFVNGSRDAFSYDSGKIIPNDGNLYIGRDPMLSFSGFTGFITHFQLRQHAFTETDAPHPKQVFDSESQIVTSFPLSVIQSTASSFSPAASALLASETEVALNHVKNMSSSSSSIEDIQNTFYLVRIAASHGSADAAFELGKLFLYGNFESIGRNLRLAVQFFELAASRGHVEAHRDLGLCYSYGIGTETIDPLKGIQYFYFSALNGDIESLLVLAHFSSYDASSYHLLNPTHEMHHHHVWLLLKQSSSIVSTYYLRITAEKAFEEHKKPDRFLVPPFTILSSSLATSSSSSDSTSNNIQKPPPSDEEEEEAISLLRLQAEQQGNAQSAFTLGNYYFNGRAGRQRDLATAYRYLNQAAEAGHADARMLVAEMVLEERAPEVVVLPHEEAAGVTIADLKLKRNETIFTYLEEAAAANSNDTRALNALGYAYFYGRGLPVDYERAIGYFIRAAEAGDAAARFNVGFMYKDGLTGDKRRNFTEAFKHFVMAAESGSGHLDAAFFAGLLSYEAIEGVERDTAAVRRLFSAVSEHGPWAARFRQALQAFQTSDDTELALLLELQLSEMGFSPSHSSTAYLLEKMSSSSLSSSSASSSMIEEDSSELFYSLFVLDALTADDIRSHVVQSTSASSSVDSVPCSSSQHNLLSSSQNPYSLEHHQSPSISSPSMSAVVSCEQSPSLHVSSFIGNGSSNGSRSLISYMCRNTSTNNNRVDCNSLAEVFYRRFIHQQHARLPHNDGGMDVCRAYLSIGDMHYDNEEKRQIASSSFSWLESAYKIYRSAIDDSKSCADTGQAHYNLAYMTEHGQGVVQSNEVALHLYQIAADREEAQGNHALVASIQVSILRLKVTRSWEASTSFLDWIASWF